MRKDDFSRMVVGFVFISGFGSVLLVQKKNPEWQRGYLNGIGGKCKENEPPRLAMTRETYEETGMDIDPMLWTHFLTLHTGGKPETAPNVEVAFYFVAVDRSILTAARTPEGGEPILIVPTNGAYHYKTVPNLQWMIPLAAKWNEGLLPYRYAKPIEVFEEPR